MRKKYHSDFIIQYKLGLLPTHIVAQIPPLTTFHWRNNDYSKFFAEDILYAQQQNMDMIKTFLARKQLLNAAKALYHIFLVIQLIAHQSKLFKQQLYNHRTLIVKTIDRSKDALGLQRVLQLFTISANQYYSWKQQRKCFYSLFNQCVRRFPNQLSVQHVGIIKNYLCDNRFKGWPNAAVYFQMIRDKATFCGLSTFYRYAKKLNLTKPRIKKPIYPKAHRATAPKQSFHIDVTILNLNNRSKAYIYIIMDNFSRLILNATASLEYKALHSFNNMRTAFENHHIINSPLDKQLFCDGGIENKGPVDDYLAQIGIDKLVAGKDVSFSNSMVEAVNKRIKYDFLFWQIFSSIDALTSYLPAMVKNYNNKPHTALFGFTPEEVFNGIIPSKDNFKAFIQHNLIKRTSNKQENCPQCSD